MSPLRNSSDNGSKAQQNRQEAGSQSKQRALHWPRTSHAPGGERSPELKISSQNFAKFIILGKISNRRGREIQVVPLSPQLFVDGRFIKAIMKSVLHFFEYFPLVGNIHSGQSCGDSTLFGQHILSIIIEVDGPVPELVRAPVLHRTTHNGI